MQWILVSLILIYWIDIYPMESAIQLLNNWGLLSGKFEKFWVDVIFIQVEAAVSQR